MRIGFFFTGTGPFAQQAARALHEGGLLDRFVTSYHYDSKSPLARALAVSGTSFASKLSAQLNRRSITEVPNELIKSYPWWEMLRIAAAKLGGSRIFLDRIWDVGSHAFDNYTAARQLDGLDAIYGYEYASLRTFQEAKRRGIVTILELNAPDAELMEKTIRGEIRRFPELSSPQNSYFDKRFSARLERRRKEIKLADLIVVNSRFTAKSYMDVGVDPRQIVTVPLGAPPVVAATRRARPNGPLRVLWAGNFSIHKGAHYLLQAWSSLNLDGAAELRIFGMNRLPEKLMSNLPSSISVHKNILRADLMAIYAESDVLIFPTLADGFGMVVTEAFSSGLPVVTTARAGAADLVRPHENGILIEPGRADAIAEALEWCMANRSTLQAMREEARRTAAGWQWGDYRRTMRHEILARVAGEGSCA